MSILCLSQKRPQPKLNADAEQVLLEPVRYTIRFGFGNVVIRSAQHFRVRPSDGYGSPCPLHHLDVVYAVTKSNRVGLGNPEFTADTRERCAFVRALAGNLENPSGQ